MALFLESSLDKSQDMCMLLFVPLISPSGDRDKLIIRHSGQRTAKRFTKASPIPDEPPVITHNPNFSNGIRTFAIHTSISHSPLGIKP